MDKFVFRRKPKATNVIEVETPVPVATDECYYNSDESEACPDPSTDLELEGSSHQFHCDDSQNAVRGTGISAKSSSAIVRTESQEHNRGRRYFQQKWTHTFQWIRYNADADSVFCDICVNAHSRALLHPSSHREIQSLNTFVKHGFSSWRKALERFKHHEKSEMHRTACQVVSRINRGDNVLTLMSAGKSKQMNDARLALIAIMSSVCYLSRQGLALRGHYDESSNLHQLVKLRCGDVPALKAWLLRNEYKWMSHETINEMLSLMSRTVLLQLSKDVKQARYFSIIVDDTTDFSTKEQVSLCFRYCSDKLEVQEMFFGFYETKSTTAKILFYIVKDALLRFNLDFKNCRGQCYDGAANVSGKFSGLRARVEEVEPRAVYVHCLAHSLNLVVQDAMRINGRVRDVLLLMRELINLIRESPKRLGWFESIQKSDGEMTTFKRLRPFCPTRWCLRVCSLRTVLDNYGALLEFLLELHRMDKSDLGSKAHGYLSRLQQFETAFLLQMLISIFERIETLNASLQKSSLHYQESKHKIDNVLKVLMDKRNDGFSEVWDDSCQFAEFLELEEPALPRKQKVPKRFHDGSIGHTYETPQDFYRPIFLEVLDCAISGLKSRFETSATEHLQNMEKFITGKIETVEHVTTFYGNDFSPERLRLHRDMFLDVMKSEGQSITNVNDAIEFLSNNPALFNLIPEFVAFLKVIVTIPVSSCVAERSFSALKRLKTYLRSTMSQQRLNDLAVLHVHQSYTDSIDLETVADEFIEQSSCRHNTFAMSK